MLYIYMYTVECRHNRVLLWIGPYVTRLWGPWDTPLYWISLYWGQSE